MPESFDPYQYIDYLRGRWRITAVACAVALGISLGGSLLLPKKYTATARIVIEPPAGSDLRAAMAVSPIYLESLKTYEHFATSDSLFVKALDHFQLRAKDDSRSVESWKRDVLKVEIPRNTKILEISATLKDPRKAQALASFLAQETVNLNSSISREGDRELAEDVQKQLDDALEQQRKVEADWSRFMEREPVEQVASEIDSMQTQRYRLERDLLDSEVRAADYGDRAAAAADGAGKADLNEIRESLRSAQLRTKFLSTELAKLKEQLSAKQALLAARQLRRQQLDDRRKAAIAAVEALRTRLREARSAVGYRVERLKIIDPGIVPEQPSFPNIPLNVIVALFAALIGSIFYITLEFNYRSGRRSSTPPLLRVAAKGRDD